MCYILSSTFKKCYNNRENGIIQLWGQKINLEGERLWGDRDRAIQARSIWKSHFTTDGNGGVISVVENGPSVQMINRNGEIGVVLEVGIDKPVDKHDPTKLSPQLQIYPNPANSMTTLSFSRLADQNMFLKIYDLQGRILYDNLIHLGVSVHPLDISTLPTGSYILQLESGATESIRTLHILK